MRYLAALLAVSIILATGCGGSETSSGEAQALVQTTTAPETTTTTRLPTPEEQLAGCLEGTIVDPVVCSGAAKVVSDSDAQAAEAIARMEACESSANADCMDDKTLVMKALEGEDISADLGPGPDEVHGPDLAALQAVYDKANQANDSAGMAGALLVSSMMSYPGTDASPFRCVGAAVDWAVANGVPPVGDTRSPIEEVLIDFNSARRTDAWTVPGVDGVLDPEGRTYAYVLTQSRVVNGFQESAEYEVHGNIDPDGVATIFSNCPEDPANPNSTAAALQETYEMLVTDGVWNPSWPAPTTDA